MSIINSFNKLSRVVQVILLLIPGINLFTEIIVRCSAACHGKAGKQVLAILLAIVTSTLQLSSDTPEEGVRSLYGWL